MGMFDWLFGARSVDDGPRGVFMGRPGQPPNLPQELEPYVRELADLYRQQKTFDYGAGERTRAIGERINATNGFKGMVAVCDALRFVVGFVAALELEGAWHGIGQWQR